MWSGTSTETMEIPWWTSGSPHPGESDGKPAVGAAKSARRRSTTRAYAESSLEGRTWRNRGVAAWRSRMEIEEMDVAALATEGGRRWEPRSSPRPVFMVSKAANAAVWEDSKDIRPPVYNWNPLNVDRFWEELDDWGMTVGEDMDPTQAEKYVFKRFRRRPPEVLQELYYVAAKEGKVRTLGDAKKWLNEQERVEAPHVPTKRWRAIKLQYVGKDIRLREWREFRGQYVMYRRNVEDQNEGDEQSRLLNLLQDADQACHERGSQEGQEEPHCEDDAQHGAPQAGGELD